MSIEKNFSLDSISSSLFRKTVKDLFFFYKKCIKEPEFFVKTKTLFSAIGLDHEGKVDSEVWKRIKNRIVHSISAVQPTFTRSSICAQMYDDTDDDMRWAYRNGAFLIITDHKIDGVPCLVVESPITVYAQLCRYYRDLRDISVTAVTGSIGKTTLKRMIQYVYESERNTFCNVVNHNALYHAGYFCQHIPKDYNVMVQEVSEDTPLYTKPMSVILNPRIVAITNITVSHIEAFGSRERIIKEVLSITEGMEQDGFVIVNKDEFHSFELLEGKNVILVSCEDSEADYYGYNISIESDGLYFDIKCKREGTSVHVHLANIFGMHNVALALQAFASGRLENIEISSIIKGLSNFKMTGMRQNYFTVSDGIHVYADCFNAVEKSFRSALSAVGNIPVKGKKVAVFGDVGELGSFSEAEHSGIAKALDESSCISVAVIYGDKLTSACKSMTFRSDLKIYYCGNHGEIIDTLDRILKVGDLVLFKGSHSCNLRDVIKKMWPDEYSRINHEERDPYESWMTMISKN